MKTNIVKCITAIAFIVLAANVYAGGTGVGNPGTTTIVKPLPPGPVLAPQHQHEIDHILS